MIIQTNPCNSRCKQKRRALVCTKPNHNILANISGKGGRIELSIFALKLFVLAGCFEYYKPYDFEILIYNQ
jgi:hypothetical protein